MLGAEPRGEDGDGALRMGHDSGPTAAWAEPLSPPCHGRPCVFRTSTTLFPFALSRPAVPSQYFFRPDSDTSPHPLIIGAGFDGTGLELLSRALRILGKSRPALPAIDMSRCLQSRSEARACGPLLRQLDEVGLQARRAMASGTHDYVEAVATPELFQGVDAVLGHPVPHFTWDFLEAFPQGKVVLTVGRAQDVWRVVAARNPLTGSAQAAGKGAALMRALVWNLGDTPMNQAHFTRKYLEHNNKIIHGVPKDQLLVWNPYKDPSWGPLCDFLGLPVPREPFPKPVEGEW
jgi:hypothetical protein